MSVTNKVSIVDNRVIITVIDTEKEKKSGLLSRAVDFVKENPVKTAVAVGVATGGAGYVAAPAIAASIGAAGALGAASTGTAISTLKGIALTNASLAKIGGSVVGGKAVITGTAGTVGAVASKTISDK